MVDNQAERRVTFGEGGDVPQERRGLGADVEGEALLGQQGEAVLDLGRSTQCGVGLSVD